jgi:hypothetical protein
MGPQGLGGMVGVQLGQLPQAPAHLFQPTPIQQGAPPLAAPPATPPPPAPAAPTSGTFGLQPSALSDLSSPNALNPSGNLAFGMANWGGMMSPQARDLYRNSQFQQPGGGYNNPGLQTLINPQAAQPGAPNAQPKSLFGLGGL